MTSMSTRSSTQFCTKFLSILLFFVFLTIAWPQAPPNPPAQRHAQVSGGSGSSPIPAAVSATGAPSAAETAGARVDLLISGLDANVAVQQAQLGALQAIVTMEKEKLTDEWAFDAAKATLLELLAADNNIRTQNLALSRINAKVARGIAQLEEAQVLTYAMAEKLNGKPGNDEKILQDLRDKVQNSMGRCRGLQSVATGGSEVPMAMQTKLESLPAGVHSGLI